LRDSVSVYRKLKHAIGELGGVGVELYVLADTSYGRQGRLSHCVIEVSFLNLRLFLCSFFGRVLDFEVVVWMKSQHSMSTQMLWFILDMHACLSEFTVI